MWVLPLYYPLARITPSASTQSWIDVIFTCLCKRSKHIIIHGYSTKIFPNRIPSVYWRLMNFRNTLEILYHVFSAYLSTANPLSVRYWDICQNGLAFSACVSFMSTGPEPGISSTAGNGPCPSAGSVNWALVFTPKSITRFLYFMVGTSFLFL